MAKMSVENVIKRASLAAAKKDEWRTIYQECYEYALPQRNLYDGNYEGGVPGQKKMQKVYDSTAIHSTQRFANRIQSSLFPPYRAWCRLQAGNGIPMQRRAEVQTVLDFYNERMFNILRQTNFDLSMSEFLLDLAVGTAIMLIQPGDEKAPIRFTAVPQYLVSLEEGPHGTVDNVYRKMKMKGDAISLQWPDANISPVLQQQIDRKPTDDVELLEATVFNKDTGSYCYYVIHEKLKIMLVYREMKVSPWIVTRYMKVAGEVYGRGPLITAMPDVKTLNKTLELVLKNASLAVSGVYTAADDGVINPQNVKIQPGAIIPVARNGGPQGPSLTPLPKSADFNVAQLVINDMRMNIKKMLLDDTLPPDNMSARSATEVVQRRNELAQNLGAAFGRLITEAMVPIVSRILFIMDQRGDIDLPLKINGEEVKIVPISPLAQAQNMEELNDVMQFVQIVAGMGPEAMMTIKKDEIIDFVAERLGVPGKLLTTPEEREQIAQQYGQMQAMAQQQQAQAAAPQGAGNQEALMRSLQ
jgi:hypothetical protein